jgi:hypothetical protein
MKRKGEEGKKRRSLSLLLLFLLLLLINEKGVRELERRREALRGKGS